MVRPVISLACFRRQSRVLQWIECRMRHTNVSPVVPAYTILSSAVSTRFICLLSPMERSSAAARSTSVAQPRESEHADI